jgi:hypothetical protein
VDCDSIIWCTFSTKIPWYSCKISTKHEHFQLCILYVLFTNRHAECHAWQNITVTHFLAGVWRRSIHTKFETLHFSNGCQYCHLHREFTIKYTVKSLQSHSDYLGGSPGYSLRVDLVPRRPIPQAPQTSGSWTNKFENKLSEKNHYLLYFDTQFSVRHA